MKKSKRQNFQGDSRQLRNADRRVNHAEDEEDRDDADRQICAACHQALGIVGGMAGTGLCGPCCTGEAETISEFGETW